MDIRRSEIDDIKKRKLDMKKKIAAIAAFFGVWEGTVIIREHKK